MKNYWQLKTSQFAASNQEHPESWSYKGYICWIELDKSGGNIKAYHYVKTPSGQTIEADINPYDRSRSILQLWVDAGLPDAHEHGIMGGWNSEQLQKMINSKTGGNNG